MKPSKIKARNVQKDSITFFTRPGYSSPVLQSKKGETDDMFKMRMIKLGWTNLEQVGFHRQPDTGLVHAGTADKCSMCLRVAKRAVGAAQAKNKTLASEASKLTEDPDDKSRKDDLAAEASIVLDEREKALPEGVSLDVPKDLKLPGRLSVKQVCKLFKCTVTDDKAILDIAKNYGYETLVDKKGKILSLVKAGYDKKGRLDPSQTDKHAIEHKTVKSAHPSIVKNVMSPEEVLDAKGLSQVSSRKAIVKKPAPTKVDSTKPEPSPKGEVKAESPEPKPTTETVPITPTTELKKLKLKTPKQPAVDELVSGD